jgi:hypothetical protein
MRKIIITLAHLKNTFSALLRRFRHQSTAIDYGEIPGLFHATLQGNEQRVAQYDALAQESAKQGLADGIHGIPDEHAAYSHAEESIADGHAEATDHVIHHCGMTRGRIKNQLATARGTLADSAALKENASRQLEPAKNKALAKVNRQTSLRGLRWLRRKRESVKGMVAVLNEHHRHWSEISDHIETRYQHLHVEVYHRIPPVRRWFDHFLVFWGVIGLLVGLEILVNFTAFQAIGAGDNNLASLGLGIFFACCQAWSAENLGTALHKKQHGRIWLFLLLTLIFCGFIIASRLNMTEENPVTHLLYWVINAIFAALTAVLAYFRAKHHAFFALQLRRKQIAERLETWRYQIEHLELAYQKKCAAIETGFDELAAEIARQREAQAAERITQYESWLSQLDAHEHKCLQRIDAIKHQALNRYRHLNEEARHKQGHPPVKRWQHILPPPAQNAAASLLLLACFVMGCSTPHPETHLSLLIDRTDTTHTRNIEPMLDYVLGLVIHDTLDPEWGEVTILLSPIGETSTPEMKSLHLPASESFWWRNELKHRKLLSKFREDLRQTLDTLTRPGTGTHHSYIHRNFHAHLHAMSRHHGTRIVLSWSDLILN